MGEKTPRRASIDEVHITHEDDYAIIEFADPTISVVRMRIGPQVAGMSDAAVLEIFNRMMGAQDALASEFENNVIEIPEGKPQIKYSPDTNQWIPRGRVLRCHISDDEHSELVVYVDDQELDLHAFGRMLRTYAGWGMRICFVDDDAVAEEPTLEVRDPDE
jgi:hypothetical protein